MTRARFVFAALIVFSLTLFAERTKLRPGTNSYSPQQDIELGQQVAKDAESQLVLVKNADAIAYVTSLGQKLAAKSPNEYKFPFTFKIVDDRAINAFALPGGPVYVNRGAIEAADNEAQIAGVIGHEMGHVILRHGTNQATKAQYAQAPLAILGSVLGGNTVGKILAGLSGFAANSILLRYSRDAESQADLMGTQILYDSAYDPHAMAEFFDKLAKEHKGTQTEQFFSNHPIPENRIAKVNDEIRKIGPVPPNPRVDSPDFQRVKRTLLAMPEPPKPPTPAAATKATDKPAPPALPSAKTVPLQAAGIQMRHPDNWKPAVQGTNITIAPVGGAIGQAGLAYGMVIDSFKPQSAGSLDKGTTELLQNIQMGNPGLKIVRSKVRTQVNGQTAQLTELSNDSPAGGKETDIIISVLRPNGNVQYFIQVAPTAAMPQYQAAFQAMMSSIRLQ